MLTDHCLQRYYSICSVVSLAIYLLFTFYRDTTAFVVSCLLTVRRLQRYYSICSVVSLAIYLLFTVYRDTTASLVLRLCL